MKPILVFYLNVGNLSPEEVEKFMERNKEKVSFSDRADCVFIPIRDGETKVECVYPQYIAEESKIEETKKILKNIENIFIKKLQEYHHGQQY